MIGEHPHERLKREQREQRAADIEDLIAIGIRDGGLEASRRQDGTIRVDEGKRLHLDAPSQETLAVVLGVTLNALHAMRRAKVSSAWAEASVDQLFTLYPTTWADAVDHRKALNRMTREGRSDDPDTMPSWVRTSIYLAKIADLQRQIRELKLAQGA